VLSLKPARRFNANQAVPFSRPLVWQDYRNWYVTSLTMALSKGKPDTRDTEPRWPAVLTLLVVFGIVELLPSRYAIAPPWFAWAVCGIGAASMLAVQLVPTSRPLRRVERVTIIGIFAVICSLGILGIVRLVADMLSQHGYDSVRLLETAIEIWAVNILNFALLYWQVDRSRSKIRPADFRFAEKDDAGTAQAWEPYFIDYLFLAFATSTSFMPPDYSRPASRRAKLLAMLQASISLTTLFLVASRAISTLS
jgi:hypothetical protein